MNQHPNYCMQRQRTRPTKSAGSYVCSCLLPWRHQRCFSAACCGNWENSLLPRKGSRDVFSFALCICPGCLLRKQMRNRHTFLVELNFKLILYLDALQVAIEAIYVTIQTFVYTLLLYSMIGFYWRVDKFLWFYYYLLMCFIYFTLYGMMIVALTPNHQIAAIVMSFFLSFWNLFSGFLIPRMVRIPTKNLSLFL